MKLSMWILADWLEKYSPEADIKTNNRSLQNVRLFSENLKFSQSTAYLVPIQYDRILCSNGNDILTLHSDDINAVLNDILDAFEYYNALEEEVLELIQSGCTLRDLLTHMSERTGYLLLVANAAFLILDAYGPDSIAAIHHGLPDIIENRMLPVEVLKQINSIPEIRRADIGSYPMTVPGLGTAMITNLFSRNHHIGWLVTCNDRLLFSQGETDLIDNLAALLSEWMVRDRDSEERNEQSGLFINWLDGNAPQEHHYEERLKAYGWYPQDEKQVYVIGPSETARLPLSTLAHYLDMGTRGQFSFEYDGLLAVIVNHALMDARQSTEHMTSLLSGTGYRAGESPVFVSMERLRTCYEAARLAARYAQSVSAAQPGNVIFRFQETIIPYSVSILKNYAAADLRHPALQLLKDYDTAHHTSLYRTLHVFLQQNCSHSQAARSLFIHRSTLIYRIEKITELTGIDYSIADEQFHLLLSFYLDSGDHPFYNL